MTKIGFIDKRLSGTDRTGLGLSVPGFIPVVLAVATES